MVPLMGKWKEKHFLPTLLTRMGKKKLDLVRVPCCYCMWPACCVKAMEVVLASLGRSDNLNSKSLGFRF